MPGHTEVNHDQIVIGRRGPEIAGTRITVYRIMDYLKYDDSASEIAEELGITTAQVEAALAYIREHIDDLNKDYEKILKRTNRANPPRVDEGAPKDRDELRRLIMERHPEMGGHDRPAVGQ
jgi:uncharacterized protein (DUF433 family)